MKIIVDAMGGDNAPLEIIKGVQLSLEENKNVQVILVGQENVIRKCMQENNIYLERTEIVNAEQVVTMEDSPNDVLKTKKDSSMSVGMRLLSENKGDAFMSAGNSGAIVIGSSLICKRIKGIKRAAFAPILPKDEGFFMLIDSGANVECRPEMLCQFALMGSVYLEKVMNIKSPRIGLANVGVEEHKGGEFRQEAYKLLKKLPINFIGNVEARDIPFDACDVVVADGFTGNIILKMYEGVAMALMKKIKGVFTKNLKTKLAAACVMPEFKNLKKSIDYNEYGGAPVMGIAKPVFKVHGSAKAKTFKNAFKLTMQYVNGDVINIISNELSKMKDGDINE